MIYLDNGATSFHKPESVYKAVQRAMKHCANPGRGGHAPAMEAAKTVLQCRERAALLFNCSAEHVVFTQNCTQGLNMAIRSLVKPGDRVVISGFEHNAVTRTLHGLGAQVLVAGRRLFDPADTLQCFEDALKTGVNAAVITHCSNVFGYVLPMAELSQLCKHYKVPLIVDAAQSAGCLPVSLKKWEAAFIAMPGHKGLLGPQGTGLLLCEQTPEPLIFGGTGSDSVAQQMPLYLPDGAEAGTLNVPGIAGLCAGLQYIQSTGQQRILQRERRQMIRCVKGLKKLGLKVFSGEDQTGTVSFIAPGDCEEFAQRLSGRGIAVRAGLHCAPLAHESAGTLDTGTVRVSFGHDANDSQTDALLYAVKKEMQNS